MNGPSELQNKFGLLFIDSAKNGYQINLLKVNNFKMSFWCFQFFQKTKISAPVG